jgi:hypothetical protein
MIEVARLSTSRAVTLAICPVDLSVAFVIAATL